MQAVVAFWQLQGTMGKHCGGDAFLQLKNPKRGLIHSHAGTGTYISCTVLERGF
jgi:acetyl-CoA C-acetyltransferase